MDKNRVKQALYGAVVGDAIGVPVEFDSRQDLKANPVSDMRGYGTYGQPKGTWSDDTSMMLATMDSLTCNGYDIKDMADKFVDWMDNAKYTSGNVVFDVGNTTSGSLDYYKNKGNFKVCKANENGNGSLMRMLPLALYAGKMEDDEIIGKASEVSAITHSHHVSRVCCAYYSGFIKRLIDNGGDVEKAYFDTNKYHSGSCIEFLNRIRFGSLAKLHEGEIVSDGYVVNTLEASLWCCLNNKTYKDAVLCAVNLGSDTDTVGCITGGIAGLAYGGVPEEWIDCIVGKRQLDNYIDEFVLKFF